MRPLPQQKSLSSLVMGLLCLTYGCGNSDSAKTNGAVGGAGVQTGGAVGDAATGGRSNQSQGGKASATGGTQSAGGGQGGTLTSGGAASNGGCCTISSSCNDCLTSNYKIGGKCSDSKTIDESLAFLPPCDQMQGTNQYTGQSNAELCKAVYSCVMRTQCAFMSPTLGAAVCYCGIDNMGVASDGSTRCFSAQDGPCKQEIEDGMNLAVPSPTKIAQMFANPNVPTGLALNVLSCQVNECSSECGVSYQSSGTGGAAASGGAPGNGGATSSSGTGGAGGTGGLGGSSGTSAGGAFSRDCDLLPTDTILYDFSGGIGAISVDTSSAALLKATLTLDGADAGTSAASLQVDVPFTNWGQQAQLDVALPSTLDLTNKTLFACVSLESGPMPENSTACSSIYLAGVDTLTREYGDLTNICSTNIGKWLLFKSKTLATIPQLDNGGNPILDTSGNPVLVYDSTHTTSIVMQFNGPYSGPSGGPLPTQAVFHVNVIGYR